MEQAHKEKERKKRERKAHTLWIIIKSDVMDFTP